MRAAVAHYSDTSPRVLRARLGSLARLGLDTVVAPVPWDRHDPDGRGPRFDRNDAPLLPLLEAAAAAGLDVRLRVGPALGDERTFLGLPRWIAADPSLAARRPDGTPWVVPLPPRPFLAPSCASRRFRERLAAFAAALAEAIAPHAGPSGPLRGAILGEAWPFGFRNVAAVADHHPDARAAWDRHLADAGRAARPLPIDLVVEDPAAAADHAAFAESLHVEMLAGLRDALAAALGPIAFAVSLPTAGHLAPIGPGRLAALGTLAVDAYPLELFGPGRWSHALERTVRLAAGSSPGAFAAAVPAGRPVWAPDAGLGDPVEPLRRCLDGGLRGFALTPAFPRDRWFGSLLDPDGRPTAEGRRLLEQPSRSAPPAPAVALFLPRHLVRLVLARLGRLLGPIAPGLAPLTGIDPGIPPTVDPPVAAAFRWLGEAEAALAAAGIPFVLADDESPHVASAPLWVIPSTGTVGAAIADRVVAHAGAGGTARFGPVVPSSIRETGSAWTPPGGASAARLDPPTAEAFGAACREASPASGGAS